LSAVDKKDGIYTFRKMEKILKPSNKSLDEARGYVIADYQDFLEKEWVSELEKKYNYQLDKSVLDSLIKK
jgi:peptidyl-prolyl cis-trans isomerase SurA